MCQHLPLSPPSLSSSCEEGRLAEAAHTEGPQSPGGPSQATPSSSKTPPVGPSTPFTRRPPFHTPVLTVDQLESCCRPLLQHTARGITIKVLCKRFKACVKLESAQTHTHTFIFSHWRKHTHTYRRSSLYHGAIVFENQGFCIFSYW